MFIALGLTVRLSELGVRDWLEGLALFVVLAVVIRPIVVDVTLAGVRMSRAEKTFIAFSGLKGAVPVFLAAFAIIGGAPDADRIPRPRVHRRARVGVRTRDASAVRRRKLGIPMHLQDRRRGSSQSGSAANRQARASTASRPVHERTGWPLATCPSATTPGSRCSCATEALQPDSDLELRPGDRLLMLADPERSHDLKATFTA